MKLVYKTLVLTIFFSITLLTQGCTSLSNSNADASAVALEQLVIAEPLAINFKSEIAIARLSEVINRVKITDEQKAQLYYDRGVL